MGGADAVGPGARVVVLGLGVFGGGLGAARWALSRGADVTVTDLRDRDALAASLGELEPFARSAPGTLQLVLGRHDEADLLGADLVVVNPAVSPHAAPLRLLRERGRAHTLTTAAALTLELGRCRFVGITGTQGKSSTSSFTAQLLTAALPEGRRVLLGGNIGASLLEEIDALGPADVAVVELSSYQLAHMPSPPPRKLDVALVTGIGVDHLKWHGSLDAYRAAKLRLLSMVAHGGAVAVGTEVDLDEVLDAAAGARVIARRPAGRAEGLSIDRHSGTIELGGDVLGSARDLPVLGDFQGENLALALAAASCLGADREGMAGSIAQLRGLPHRVEHLGRFVGPGGDVFEVVDNGISTTPESTASAFEACTARFGGTGVLVAGGQLKGGQDLPSLARALAGSGWRLVPFGEAADALAEALGVPTLTPRPDAGWPARAREATDLAATHIGHGETLLFSPACASFDAYLNFAARARDFRSGLPPREPTGSVPED